MSVVGGLPCGLGGQLIDLLGHMHAPESLRRSLGGVDVASPIGMGHLVDPEGHGIRAWDRFGFGFLEVGPVRREAVEDRGLRQNAAAHTITVDLPQSGETSDSLYARLGPRAKSLRHPVWIRILMDADTNPSDAADWVSGTMRRLAVVASAFTLERSAAEKSSTWTAEEWRTFWVRLRELTPQGANAIPYWWVVSVHEQGPLLESIGIAPTQLGIAGVVLESRESGQESRVYGAPNYASLPIAVTAFRKSLGNKTPLIASGGIHQPAQVIELLDRGADGVTLDTGFIFSGPGLPKRANAALEASRLSAPTDPEVVPGAWSFNESWVWMFLLGTGMSIGAALAVCFALTKVVFSYDEVFCGLTRAQLMALHPRLLPFMAHDRMTLAGTMITIGTLYLCFSWFGARRGLHWCRTAVLVSAGAGFLSFFLFLGFDYFDPFHAFVTCILFQLFVQALVGRKSPERPNIDGVDLKETPEWRRGQWGQLLLVLHAAGLLIAGLVIACVGVSRVLISTDEQFLGITRMQLVSAEGRLLPLIAHDRATLGGMLVASGLLYLLSALWGIRRGERWLWHAMLWGGLPAYAAALGIHLYVGYTDWIHLLPAVSGLFLLLIGAALTRRWMLDRSDPASG